MDPLIVMTIMFFNTSMSTSNNIVNPKDTGSLNLDFLLPNPIPENRRGDEGVVRKNIIIVYNVWACLLESSAYLGVSCFAIYC